MKPMPAVVADFDGIAVVPKADIIAVLERTEEIVEIEKTVRSDMRRGVSPLQGLTEHGHI